MAPLFLPALFVRRANIAEETGKRKAH